MQLPILYPNGCIFPDPSLIDMSERERDDLGDIPAFAESLKMFGILQPPLITDHPDKPGHYLPITGGRRLAAYAHLALPNYPCSYRPLIPRHQFKEMELEENEQRLAMSWQEKVKCIAKSHQLRVTLALDQNKIWTQRASGAVFGCSHTHVGNCIMLYEYIVAGDKEIITAPTVGDAIEVLIKRQEDAAQAELARRAASQMFIPTPPSATPGPAGVDPAFTTILPKFLNTATPPKEIAGFLGPVTKSIQPSGQPSCQDKVSAPSGELKRFSLSKRFVLGDCLEYMRQCSPNRFDHVVTDPPYAIDLKNMEDIKDIELVKDQHQIGSNLEFLKEFIPLVYKVLRPNGYFMHCYDLDNHEKLQEMCKAAGFKVQRWPLTWHKLHNCKNDAAQYNFTKTTEWVMVCRK
jgi:ParB-like chromosome segregation protein Spo0J